LNLISSYNDLKFTIRCVDVWKNLMPTDDELNDAISYHVERSKKREIGNLSDEKVSKLNSMSLQDYLEMLIDVIQEETGTWFFYVDVAGVIFDQVQSEKIFIYQTDSGYCVIFQKLGFEF
jgi:hypothetical protein